MSDSPTEAGPRYEFQRVLASGLPVVEVSDRSGARPRPLRIYPEQRNTGWGLPDDHKLPGFKGHFKTAEHVVDRFFELTEDEENRAQIEEWVNSRWAIHEADVAKDSRRWPLFILLVAAKLGWFYVGVWHLDLLPKAGLKGYPIMENLIPDTLKGAALGLPVLYWPPAAVPSRLRRALTMF